MVRENATVQTYSQSDTAKSALRALSPSAFERQSSSGSGPVGLDVLSADHHTCRAQRCMLSSGLLSLACFRKTHDDDRPEDPTAILLRRIFLQVLETNLASGMLEMLLAGGRVVMVTAQLRLTDNTSPLQEWSGPTVLSLPALERIPRLKQAHQQQQVRRKL